MEDVTQALNWMLSGDGRLIAAAVLTLVMFGIKSVPWVEANVLTTPRRRLLATGLLALAPVVPMLATGAPLKDAILTGVTAFLAAIGLHTGGKVAVGKPVGVAESTDPPSTVFKSAEGDKVHVYEDGRIDTFKRPQ